MIEAVGQAENILGTKIKRAYISIDSISLSSCVSNGSVTPTKSDQEITELDVSKAINLGWSYKIELKDGIKQTYELIKNRFWIIDLNI